MVEFLYIMLMENKNKLNFEVISRHVEHLKKLEVAGKLILCGPFTDYGGGMVVLNVSSYEEANEICTSDPYISEGYKTYQLRTLECANKDNHYLLT